MPSLDTVQRNNQTFNSRQPGSLAPDPSLEARNKQLEVLQALGDIQKLPPGTQSQLVTQLRQIVAQGDSNLTRALKQNPGVELSTNGGTPQEDFKRSNPVPASGGSISETQTQQLSDQGAEPIQPRPETQPSAERSPNSKKVSEEDEEQAKKIEALLEKTEKPQHILSKNLVTSKFTIADQDLSLGEDEGIYEDFDEGSGALTGGEVSPDSPAIARGTQPSAERSPNSKKVSEEDEGIYEDFDESSGALTGGEVSPDSPAIARGTQPSTENFRQIAAGKIIDYAQRNPKGFLEAFQKLPAETQSAYIAQIVSQGNNKLNRALKQNPGVELSTNEGTPQEDFKRSNPVPASGGSISETQAQQLSDQGAEPIQPRPEAQPSTQRQSSESRFYKTLELIMASIAALFNGLDPTVSTKNAVLKKKDALSAANNEYQKGLAIGVTTMLAAGVQLGVGAVGFGMDFKNRSRSTNGEDGASPVKSDESKLNHEIKTVHENSASKNLGARTGKSAAEKASKENATAKIKNQDEQDLEKGQEKKTEDKETQSTKTENDNKENKKPSRWERCRDSINMAARGISDLLKGLGEVIGAVFGKKAAKDRANQDMDDTTARSGDTLQQNTQRTIGQLSQEEADVIKEPGKTWVGITSK